jgi:D-proline reductase (dithiol) PrdB
VCHQTVSLVARHLEAAGIATVVLGSARDIVEECGVARFLYTDFPLGNPCGKPYDAKMQSEITGCALDLLDTATMPRTSVQTPYVWDEDASWKDRYARVEAARAAKLKAAGDARRARQNDAKRQGRTRTS